jgi:hypothetical protein
MKLAKSVVLALAVLIATSAFAGNSNKGSLHLGEAALINGQSVPAGDYQLRWEGTGAVEVSVMQGKKLVTKSPAKVIELANGASNNDVAVVDKSSATPSVTEVRFAGKKFALSLGGAEKAGMGESTK